MTVDSHIHDAGGRVVSRTQRGRHAFDARLQATLAPNRRGRITAIIETGETQAFPAMVLPKLGILGVLAS